MVGALALTLTFVLAGLLPAHAGRHCAMPAADPMPHGGGHDHTDAAQHGFACGVRSVAYRDVSTLVPEAMQFGEADVRAGRAAMATAYPEAGFVLFDVSRPGAPRPVSRFRSEPCEVVVMDYDCGADVKLSDDGALAFLALQRSRVPQGIAQTTQLKPSRTGIVVVDLSDPGAPREIGFAPIAPRGTHLLAYHRIGGAEYVFAVHNGVGFSVFRLTRPATLRLVADVRTPNAHDVFVYDDPADRRTYLYFSAASAGLLIYDVSDPAAPRRVGSWQPPLQQPDQTWYVHGAWTFREGGKRYTLVGPELSRPGEDHAVLPAPLWLLDTTEHARPVLVGEWRNPSNRAAGSLGFSVHNFWLDGRRSWVAHYHGGVWLLDWSPVLDGTARSPAVLGYYVPHESRRPFTNIRTQRRFLSAFDTNRRPMVWDVVSDGAFAYVSDITGGFSVLAAGDAPAAPAAEGRGVAVIAGLAVLGVATGWLVLRRRAREVG